MIECRDTLSGMKPSIGRIVLIPTGPLGEYNNGAKVAPAIITRVWADNMVNLRVLLDGNDTPWKTSVTLYESAEALRESGSTVGCYWPPRV